MAHPCISCGGECYCSGDIDDCVVSKTPARCGGCGCDKFDDFDPDSDFRGVDGWDDDDVDWEDQPVGWHCLGCGATYLHNPGDECPKCTGHSIEPY